MNKKMAIEYLSAREECSIPDFQKRFSLNYAEVRKLFRDLEKSDLIKYAGGLKFVCGGAAEPPKSESFIFNLKVEFARLPPCVSRITLEYAVNSRNIQVSVSDISDRLGESYDTANMVYAELKRLKLIGKDGLINISAADCKKALE